MLIKYLAKKWPYLAAYLVLVVITPIVNANGTFLYSDMMDYVGAGEFNAFLKTLWTFLGFFFLHGGLLFLVQTLRIRLISFCRQDLKQDMFEKIMHTGNAFFAKPDPGFHIAAFSNDITILETKYFEAWLELIEAILTMSTALVALIYLNTRMAQIIVIGEIFSLLLCYLIRNYSISKNRAYIDTLALFTQRIKDYFTSFQTIANYSVEAQIKRRFSRMNRDVEEAKDDADMALSFVDTLTRVCNSMIKFMIVTAGVVLMMRGHMTMGLVYTAYRFTDQLIAPMHTLLGKTNSITSVKSIVNRIRNLSSASESEQQEPILLEEPAVIEMNRVNVNIGGKQILNDLTYTFEPGKKYLLIGRNGAGKSTMLRLLKRSMEDYGGSIRINGRELQEYSYHSLANIVSYINESVSLICDTVRQNITLYRDIPEERVQEVVRQVGLTVDLDRVVRDGERNLSSGETRRIEIARSLINRADVIIYDEAISTLDIPTAHTIEKTLLELPDQTLLFVSHNFSSQMIDRYDQILLLDNGRICESGTHAELLKTSAYYRRIMEIKNGT